MLLAGFVDTVEKDAHQHGAAGASRFRSGELEHGLDLLAGHRELLPYLVDGHPVLQIPEDHRD